MDKPTYDLDDIVAGAQREQRASYRAEEDRKLGPAWFKKTRAKLAKLTATELLREAVIELRFLNAKMDTLDRLTKANLATLSRLARMAKDNPQLSMLAGLAPSGHDLKEPTGALTKDTRPDWLKTEMGDLPPEKEQTDADD